MGQLLPFSFVYDNLKFYFRDIEFNRHTNKNQVVVKNEYPYILFLNIKHVKLLPKIREIVEEQCKSIAIVDLLKLDYQIPNSKGHDGMYNPYDFFMHRHGYYVVYCRLEEDQMLLKLAIPEFTTPSIYDPDYEHWHRARIEEYQEQCKRLGQLSNLERQQQLLENALKNLR